MRAVVLEKIDGDYQLVLKDIAIPLPLKGEVLVRIQCVGVNRQDLVDSLSLLIKKYDVGSVIGQEICGTISDVGEDCIRGFQLGDQVIAHIPCGAYAEFVVVDERLLLKAPFGTLPMAPLAAVPFAYMAAYHAAFQIGRIQYGDLVLVHAAGGSVGLALIHLLRDRGIAVIATVRSEGKKLLCQQCGANFVFNLTETNGKYAKAIIEKFQQGVNIILDPVGSTYLAENILSLERGGKIIYFGTMSGGDIRDTLFLQKLIESEITVSSANLRLQSIQYQSKVIDILIKEFEIISKLRNKVYHIPVYQTLSLEDFVLAHDIIRRNENVGKVVLMVTSTSNAVDELQKELICLQKKEYKHYRK